MKRHLNVSNPEQGYGYAEAVCGHPHGSADLWRDEQFSGQIAQDNKSACNVSPDCAKVIVVVGLLESIGPIKNELALWRSFLADEIEAILRE